MLPRETTEDRAPKESPDMTARIRNSLRRAAVTSAVALAATGGLVTLAGPASAADKPGPNPPSSSPAKPDSRTGKNGVCESGELCLYYLQDKRGAFLDLFVSDPDFSNDVLRGGTPGNLANANNNTRSIRNRDSFYWRVYDGTNYTGTVILCAAPGDVGNFTASLWDRASSASYSSTAC